MAAKRPAKVITWRDLIGEKDWEGLLKPLKPQLGQELTRYCKLIGVIIESFQEEEDSPLLGLPQHSESELLSLAGLSNDYTVEKYLFASTLNIRPENDDSLLGPQSGYSNWMGYVAVNTDKGMAKIGRREIVITIRGTIKREEWYPKFCMQELVPAHDIFPKDRNVKPKLQEGRYDYYVTADSHESGYNRTSFRDQVLEAVKGLVAKYQSEENLSIVVAGFSMGGAFATLIATDLVYNGYNRIDGRANAIPVTAFAFANSPVGNKGFLNVASKLNDLHILNVKHESDVNPDSPTQKDGYFHVGKQLVITMGVHNLDVYRQAIGQSQQAETSAAPMCPAPPKRLKINGGDDEHN
ncbi:phospholipase A1-IIgamma [Ziziphus jujuba]|uniref:Phospholipase A1 n=2 Tax=Ziziphus jujuba TaxID=326968 RepID=A0A6P4B1U1_ZIZJJ|nr:phospholipase A1-IIgamma [Ziziphus jujuba]KAH7516656.1 hypothetical protein FEM48_Zijuj10G0158200 [Ziziphus jujuba var. spinosa]